MVIKGRNAEARMINYVDGGRRGAAWSWPTRQMFAQTRNKIKLKLFVRAKLHAFVFGFYLLNGICKLM